MPTYKVIFKIIIIGNNRMCMSGFYKITVQNFITLCVDSLRCS